MKKCRKKSTQGITSLGKLVRDVFAGNPAHIEQKKGNNSSMQRLRLPKMLSFLGCILSFCPLSSGLTVIQIIIYFIFCWTSMLDCTFSQTINRPGSNYTKQFLNVGTNHRFFVWDCKTGCSVCHQSIAIFCAMHK